MSTENKMNANTTLGELEQLLSSKELMLGPCGKVGSFWHISTSKGTWGTGRTLVEALMEAIEGT